MNQSSLRDRLIKLIEANRPLLDSLPDRIIGDMPPIVKVAASGILHMIPANITDITITKVKNLPDEKLAKLWNTMSKMYNYCNTEPGGEVNDESRPGVSGTVGQNDDIGSNG